MEKDGRPRGGGRGFAGTKVPILFPSGEDANPLNRRLPAEVVSRRRARRPEDGEEGELELKTVLALKPEARPKWFVKACRLVEDGRASASELYNIVSSRKFATGLPHKIGQKILGLVREHLVLFSDKQQRYLQSRECLLVASYAAEHEQTHSNSDDEEADAAARMEEMMARCRAFVREKASTFEARTAECEETERKAKLKANYEREHAAMEAEDTRTHQRVREAEELARKAALEAEERARREEFERKELEHRLACEAQARQQRLAYEAEIAKRQEFALKRHLENDVDSSMMMLERKNLNTSIEPKVMTNNKSARTLNGNHSRGLSRSRSISSGEARHIRSKDHSRDRSKDHSRDRKSHRSKDRSRDRSRDHSRDRKTHRSKDRSRDRSKDHSRDRKTHRSKDRSRDRSKDRSKDHSRDRKRHNKSLSRHHDRRRRDSRKRRRRRSSSSSSSRS